MTLRRVLAAKLWFEIWANASRNATNIAATDRGSILNLKPDKALSYCITLWLGLNLDVVFV